MARRRMQRHDRFTVIDRHATVDSEGQRDQRMTEHHAAQLDQRQHAHDAITLFRDEVEGAVAEDADEDFAPSDAVEERRLRTRTDELLPAVSIGVLVRTSGDRADRRRDGGLGDHAMPRP